jgi:pyruvate kinase
VPILTITRNERTSRTCHLYRGVYPFLYEKPRAGNSDLWQEDVDARIRWGMMQARDLGLISSGDFVVAIQGWTAGAAHSNTLRVFIPLFVRGVDFD